MELTPYPNTEGRPMGSAADDATRLADIRRRIGNLPSHLGDRYRQLMADCSRAGQPISLKDNPTEKRYDVARGILHLMEADCYDPDLVAAIIGHVTGNSIRTAAHGIAHLEPRHTAGFAWMCGLIANGDAAFGYDPTTDRFFIKEETSNV